MRTATPLQRQWHILISLMSRRQGLTVKQMASEAKVPDRTILRDLKSLKSLGFCLEERVSDHGRKHWQFVDRSGNIRIHFTWQEAIALYLGRQLLDPLIGTYFWNSAQSAFAKIRTMLDETALVQLEHMSRGFLQTASGRSDYSEKAELIDRLMLGIEERRVTFVIYRSERATEPVSLEVYPYGLVYHKGWLYLVAYSRDHESVSNSARQPRANPPLKALDWKPPIERSSLATSSPDKENGSNTISAIRTFKIDRVLEVDVQSLQFTPDPSFQLDAYFSDSFGIYQGETDRQTPPELIRIRFAKDVARYVSEKQWHRSQKLIPEKDGSTILELRLGNTRELKSWVLGFGPRAIVLAPQSLKDEIVSDLEQLMFSYEVNDHKQMKKLSR